MMLLSHCQHTGQRLVSGRRQEARQPGISYSNNSATTYLPGLLSGDLPKVTVRAPRERLVLASRLKKLRTHAVRPIVVAFELEAAAALGEDEHCQSQRKEGRKSRAGDGSTKRAGGEAPPSRSLHGSTARYGDVALWRCRALCSAAALHRHSADPLLGKSQRQTPSRAEGLPAASPFASSPCPQ
jgi:hypothetical protein